MKFQAKITEIQDEIEEIYNITNFEIVKDKYDTWIRVDEPDEAELIEELNKAKFDYNVSLKVLKNYLKGAK